MIFPWQSETHFRRAQAKARDVASALVDVYRADAGSDAELEPLARAVETHRYDDAMWHLAGEVTRELVANREHMTDPRTSRRLVAAAIREIEARERRPKVTAAVPDDAFAGLTEADAYAGGAR